MNPDERCQPLKRTRCKREKLKVAFTQVASSDVKQDMNIKVKKIRPYKEHIERERERDGA